MFYRMLVPASLFLACLLLQACSSAPRRAASFSELRAMKPTRSWRFSSSALPDWANSNGDARPLEPGQTITLADIEGPGIIRHIWFTVASPDAQFSEVLVLRAWWDGEAEPSIEAEAFLLRASHSGAAGLMPQKEHFWSGGEQLFLLAPDAGAELVLPIDVPVAGKQRVELFLTRAQDYGIHDIFWGERLVAANVDLWGAATTVLPLSLGVLDVEAGAVEPRFVNRGAGPRSRRLDTAGPGHMLGVDAVRLVDVGRWMD